MKLSVCRRLPVEDIPALGDVVLDMQVLSEVEQGGFSAALNPLANAYEAWLDEQSASLENPTEDLGAFKEYGNCERQICS